MTLKARVRAGRLVFDEPTDYPRAPKWSSCLWTPATGSMTRIALLCTMPSANQMAIWKLAVSSARKTFCANFAPREAPTGSVHRHCAPSRPSRARLVGDQPRKRRGVRVGSRSRARLDRHAPGGRIELPANPGNAPDLPGTRRRPRLLHVRWRSRDRAGGLGCAPPSGPSACRRAVGPSLCGSAAVATAISAPSSRSLKAHRGAQAYLGGPCLGVDDHGAGERRRWPSADVRSAIACPVRHPAELTSHVMTECILESAFLIRAVPGSTEGLCAMIVHSVEPERSSRLRWAALIVGILTTCSASSGRRDTGDSHPRTRGEWT